jgi:hypothetical protein
MKQDDLINNRKNKECVNNMLIPYSAPVLTVFGKVNDITKATKAHGSKSDGSYTCGEAGNSMCFS